MLNPLNPPQVFAPALHDEHHMGKNSYQVLDTALHSSSPFNDPQKHIMGYNFQLWLDYRNQVEVVTLSGKLLLTNPCVEFVCMIS